MGTMQASEAETIADSRLYKGKKKSWGLRIGHIDKSKEEVPILGSRRTSWAHESINTLI
jgi:hypothetical protein